MIIYDSASEAAKAVQVTTKTITNWIKNGRLSAERISIDARGRSGWRIRHDDLMAATRGRHDAPQVSAPMMLDDPDSYTRDATSLMVRWPANQHKERFNLDLLQGYQRLRAITYTVSIPMIYRLPASADYDEFQVIFGHEGLVSANAATIMNLHEGLEKELGQGYIGIGGDADPKTAAIMQRIAEGQVEFRAMKDKIVHSKLYLLDSPGKNRVIIGSANLSELAFSGRQGEMMLAYDNDPCDPWMWSESEGSYKALYGLASIGVRPNTAVRQPTEVIAIENTALYREVVKQQKSVNFYVPVGDADSPGSVERLAVVMDSPSANNWKLAMQDIVKPDKTGTVQWTPAVVKTLDRNLASIKPQEGIPTPHLTCSDCQFHYNGKPLERPTLEEADQVRRDALLFIRYLENYTQFGDNARAMQRDYFAVVGWMFFTPFIPRLKRARDAQGPGDYRTKQAAILYGESNCGKSNLGVSSKW